jgi:Zn finger protein HypA/HybF involved in hydrogenase expression
MKKLTTEQFIEKAKIKHNGKFDYSKIEYVNNSSKVKIICGEHGEFEQIPNSHLLGSGCPKCHNLNTNTNEFIKKANLIHCDKFDYSKVDYKHSKKNVIIICNEHGEFEQSPNLHLKGRGCPNCGGTLKLTTDDFIKKSNVKHNNLYDYSKVNYINSKTKVNIVCKIHGEFNQQPDSHLSGIGCPICSSSKGELLVNNFLVVNNIQFKPQHKFPDCKYKRVLPFDFYLPDYNICVEFDGMQHYKSVKYFGGDKIFVEQQLKDKIKSDYCIKNNIKLIRIKEKNKINEILKKELNL